MGWAFTASVWCSEWVPFESADDQLRAAGRCLPCCPTPCGHRPRSCRSCASAATRGRCPRPPDSVRGVTDTAIPTLGLSGSYDGQTGAQWGSYVSAHLSHATVVTVPSVGHGVYTDACGVKVIASFFSNPAQPDTSCVGSTLPPAYSSAPLP
jgi:pimeloyl-ACP methyl ester carboxylesterase